MAKYKRYRKYSRRGRGRWSSNIQEFNGNLTASPGTWAETEQILSNPYQSSTMVTQRYTVKNVEFSFTFEVENNSLAAQSIEGLTAYLMYVPQGFGGSSSLPVGYNILHPEYILAYKYLGSPSHEASSASSTGQQYQPYKIKTRLARKLDTGDSIVLFIKGLNQSTETQVFRLNGVVRWWTKAN